LNTPHLLSGESVFFLDSTRQSVVVLRLLYCDTTNGIQPKEIELTKADLVDKVTALGDLTRRDGEIIVDVLFDSVIGALKSGDKIEIRGFGSFRTRQRNSRIGRNPKTGEKVDVPAKRVPFFKPSKELRDTINPKAESPNAANKHLVHGVVDPHHPPAM
jgi:integration host factor subunit beta